MGMIGDVFIRKEKMYTGSDSCKYAHICDFFLVNGPREKRKANQYINKYCNGGNNQKECIHYQQFKKEAESALPYDIAPDGVSIL